MQHGFWMTRAEDHDGVGYTPDWVPPDFGKAPGVVTGYIQRLR